MARLWGAGAASVIEIGVIGCVVDELLVDSRGLGLPGQGQKGSFVLITGDRGANALNPFIGIAFCRGFKAVIRRWGKDAEDMSPG